MQSTLATLDACRQLFADGQTAAVIDMLAPLTQGEEASPDALLLLGLALNQLGRHEEAVPVLERLDRLRPGFNPGLEDLARAYERLGRIDEAMGPLRDIIARVPGHSAKGRLVRLLVDRARTLSRDGHDDLALPLLKEAADINHTAPDVLLGLGSVLNQLNRPAQGEEMLRLALTFYPAHPPILVVLSGSLSLLGRHAEAEAICRELLDGPGRDIAEAWANLGVALYGLNRTQEAEAAFRRAVALKPDQMETLINLGNVASVDGRAAEARAFYDQARAVSADGAAVDFHAAVGLLRAGDWAEGWALYESRFNRNARVIEPVPSGLPVWPGGPAAGRRLLLCHEQGYGDSLQFYRYAGLLADQGATVGLAVPPALARLFRISDPRLTVLAPDAVVPDAWEVGLPLMSAPHRLGTRVGDVPAAIPYLSPDPAQASAWRQRLAALPGLKVGLVWAGDARPHNPEATNIDRRRSIALSALSDLASVPGISFVSLQKGPPAAQIADFPLPLTDWTAELSDFADTAALVAGLDLVITVDTAMAHLAGGLGKPVFVLSRHDGCWRWLWGRDDTPWYPSMRLFRQEIAGDWSGPLARLREVLMSIVAVQ